jgi:hypothetical protein
MKESRGLTEFMNKIRKISSEKKVDTGAGKFLEIKIS